MDYVGVGVLGAELLGHLMLLIKDNQNLGFEDTKVQGQWGFTCK